MNEKPIKRLLAVALTTTEKLEFGQRLARAHQEYSEVEREKKATADGFKERLDEIDGRTASLSVIVRDGEEYRYVECSWRYLFEADTKELIRMDTGEIVETAAITSEERQMMLQADQEREAKEAAAKD